MAPALLALLLALAGFSLPAQAVFRFTSEVSATASDGTSATSKVTLTLAPGLVWHATFVACPGKGGASTPQAFYAMRGGLFGLYEGEAMCFGVLKHHGSASAGGRTLSGPGSNQQNSSGSAWTLQEDAARFTRTQDGGVIRCTPEVYLDEGPPEFALLGPGAYDFGSEGDDRYHALMTFRLTNEDLKNLQKMRKTQEGTFTSEDGYCTQRYKLTLEGVPPEDETEISVEVEEETYLGWEPEGQLAAPEQPGNSLLVKVSAHKKGDPSTARRAKLTISLPHVSKNPGVCMNWPAESAAGREGLRFRTDDFTADGPLRFVDITHLESTEEVDKVEFRVHAYDYGAWGTLRVAGKDPTGSEVTVKTRGKDTPDLSIPLDENGNRVADAWEERMGVRGLGASSDEDDQPAGKPGTRGDGLSLYEEYRGFTVKGEHVRTDARKKDLFVCDTTQLGEAAIGFFAKLTGLTVHRVTQDELGASSRVINRQSVPETHALDQHGLLIKRAPAGMKDPEAIGAPAGVDPGPPGNTEYIALPETDYVHDNAQVVVKGAQGAMSASIGVLAHELCHGVGVSHHGDATILAAQWEWEQGVTGGWRLMETLMGGDGKTAMGAGTEIHAFSEAGQELKPGDELPSEGGLKGLFHVFWKAGPSKEGTEGSGVSHCIMCYTIGRAYCSKTPGVRYVIPPQERVRDPFSMVLCDTAKGSGTNDPGHSPESHHGDAARGNCKAQIVVSDKYMK
jgi:hypothetical protein